MNGGTANSDQEADLDRQESLDRIEVLIARAEVQQLPLNRLLDELASATSGYPAADMLQRLAVTRLSSDSRTQLVAVLERILATLDEVRSVNWRRVSRILQGLLRGLTEPNAVKAVRPLLNHRLKSRRDLAYSVFRWASIDKASANLLLSKYADTGDERVLKVLVAAKGSARVADLLSLLPKFEDRYWHMRILQALMAVGISIPREVVPQYPTEFVQAMARLNDRSQLTKAQRLLRMPRLRTDPKFLAFYAWAMFQMEEFDAVVALRRLVHRRSVRTRV